jgi:predicted dehydrogenase
VLVEKPIAMNAGEAAEMVKAAKANGKKLMVGMVNRFAAKSQFIKQAIADGWLGDIYAANVLALRRRGIPGWGAFHIKKESAGGPLIDIGVHMLDLTLWFMEFPKPVSVSGTTYTAIGNKKPDVVGWSWTEKVAKEYDVEDYASALVRFDNGASLVLRASWAANIGNEQMNSELLGTKGGARWNPCEIYSTRYMSTVNLVPQRMPEIDNFYEEVKAFCDALRSPKKDVPCTGEQALIVQSILDGIYESSKKGREVKVKLPEV